MLLPSATTADEKEDLLGGKRASIKVDICKFIKCVTVLHDVYASRSREHPDSTYMFERFQAHEGV